ncbi:predicted protein [Lichtheimia corymbifera JMRC:FSU:9682]|uniref:Uncharacterized protein n=1 Tax=Lichtheimia corymbifera JMRC:FSU:9682 TaxID=1263082 RepID=A0A068S6M2_9FUNG|nr:predicted protein [Lichtheimia corymbifera JMRC:FSU:9682]
MKCGVFNRTKLLVGVKPTLCASFTMKPDFGNGRLKKTQEVDRRSTLAGGDIAKSRIDHDDRETSTQDIFGPDEQLCSIDDPTFHCKVWRNRRLYVLSYAVSVMELLSLVDRVGCMNGKMES